MEAAELLKEESVETDQDLLVRKRAAQEYFQWYCKDTKLPEVFGSASRWAIVGGAVRDCLLSNELHESFLRPWRDLDVAVITGACRVHVRRRGSGTRRLEVLTNSFGGWKIREAGADVIDAWTLPDTYRQEHGILAWGRYLSSIDYSANAAAFVWPEREVIVHDTWLRHLRHRTVRRLGPLPQRAVQPARAVALAIRMEQLSNWNFRLGRELRAEFEWLTQLADETAILDCLRYLRSKIASGRWPYPVLWRFLREVSKSRPGTRFLGLFAQVFHFQLILSQEPSHPKGRMSETPYLFNDIPAYLAT